MKIGERITHLLEKYSEAHSEADRKRTFSMFSKQTFLDDYPAFT